MRRASLVPTLGLAILAGCSASGGSSGEGDADVGGTYGYLTIERSGSEGVARTTAIARFVHGRAGVPDDNALRVAGIDRVFPAIGTCASLDERFRPSAVSVDLADFGPVVLQHDDSTETVLSPRSVPDPVGAVSGVFFYGTVEGATARLALHFRGGASVAVGAPPKDLGDVRVVTSPKHLVVSWAEDAEGTDSIFADVAATNARVRCAFADTGTASVALDVGEGDGTLTLRRVHRVSFHDASSGISKPVTSTEGGEARYDVIRSVAFRREP